MKGLPNQTFNPQGNATRAEAATVTHNLMNNK
ncbi:S-layer homology domain-containing protein [Lysinibacillus sp. BW-2-10]